MIRPYCQFLLFFLLCIFSASLHALPLEQLKLPPGFKVSLYAHVPDARQMTLGEDGTVFVGTKGDAVYAVLSAPDYSKATQVLTVASGLNSPNGVAYKNNQLYIAEINKIRRLDNIRGQIKANEFASPKVIFDQLPSLRWHGYRYIKWGKDGFLYISIGMPCNVCLPTDKRFGTIARLNAEGGEFQIYANGIRNSMGFDWDPKTGYLWFTDNGQDLLGDDFPPDELNMAPMANLHFGYPFFNGRFPDKTYNRYKDPLVHYAAPVLELGPHVAALGMTFYRGHAFPKAYQEQIFIAQHGSWNRSHKIGYRIMLVSLKDGKPSSYTPFVTGWLQNEQAWGRPVDLLVLPDGSMLVSDDYSGSIYRVSYSAAGGSI